MHISFRKNPSSILIICALCVVFLIGSVFGHLNAGGSSADPLLSGLHGSSVS